MSIQVMKFVDIQEDYQDFWKDFTDSDFDLSWDSETELFQVLVVFGTLKKTQKVTMLQLCLAIWSLQPLLSYPMQSVKGVLFTISLAISPSRSKQMSDQRHWKLLPWLERIDLNRLNDRINRWTIWILCYGQIEE